MKLNKSIELMANYSKCPKCGSDKLGKNQGGLILEETYLRRFCSCGFDITVDENGEEVIDTCRECLSDMKKDEIMYCESCGVEICINCHEENEGFCGDCIQNCI